MPTPVRTSAYTQYNPYTPPTPGPAVPAPVETPTPAPGGLIGVPKGPYGDPAWWKQRGGHELYGMFEQINKQNPWAARAFWDQVVGMGRGQNDLQAATIHKMFGGDMNAYNRWRNEPHSQGMEGRIGNFDLNTGKWSNANMYPGGNPWGDTDFSFQGWDPSKMQVGLQSIAGNEEKGAESWQTYLGNPRFGSTGVNYGGPAPRADGRSMTETSVPGSYLIGKNPGRAGGTAMAPPPAVPGPAAGPSMSAPPPTTVNTGTSATNPTGQTGGYRFGQNVPGRVNRNWN